MFVLWNKFKRHCDDHVVVLNPHFIVPSRILESRFQRTRFCILWLVWEQSIFGIQFNNVWLGSCCHTVRNLSCRHMSNDFNWLFVSVIKIRRVTRQRNMLIVLIVMIILYWWERNMSLLRRYSCSNTLKRRKLFFSVVKWLILFSVCGCVHWSNYIRSPSRKQRRCRRGEELRAYIRIRELALIKQNMPTDINSSCGWVKAPKTFILLIVARENTYQRLGIHLVIHVAAKIRKTLTPEDTKSTVDRWFPMKLLIRTNIVW